MIAYSADIFDIFQPEIYDKAQVATELFSCLIIKHFIKVKHVKIGGNSRPFKSRTTSDTVFKLDI